jgi:hypothetical protein
MVPALLPSSTLAPRGVGDVLLQDAAWELTQCVSPRPAVRLIDREASGVFTNTYSGVIDVEDGAGPRRPWAMHLADRAKMFHFVCFDLDAGAGDPVTDASVLCGLLDGTGIDYLVCESGPSGGRHVWVSMEEPAPAALVSALARRLSTVLESLDTSPLMNPATGSVRPPGAPHRHGGISRIISGDVSSMYRPTTLPGQLRVLLSRLPTEDPVLDSREDRSELRHLPLDKAGRPYLQGTKRELSPAIAKLLASNGANAADPSAHAYSIVLGMVRARWRHQDALAVLQAPGMEHFRTQKTGVPGHMTRRSPRPRGRHAHSTESVLARSWKRACIQVAFHSDNSAGHDPVFEARIHGVRAAVWSLQERADAAMGRWRTGGGPSDRTVLDALCLLASQAHTTTIQAPERYLAKETGISRPTINIALKRLAADGWISKDAHARGPLASSWQIPLAPLSTEDPEHAWPQGNPPPATTPHLQRRLRAGRHDAFTQQGLGRKAGYVYARLDERDAPESPLNILGELYHAGLVKVRKGRWIRTSQSNRDLYAAEIGIFGTLKRREAAYELDRRQWEWWLSELEWMHSPTRAKPPREYTGQLSLVTGERTQVYAKYPRRAGRADHEKARRLLTLPGVDKQLLTAA